MDQVKALLQQHDTAVQTAMNGFGNMIISLQDQILRLEEELRAFRSKSQISSSDPQSLPQVDKGPHTASLLISRIQNCSFTNENNLHRMSLPPPCFCLPQKHLPTLRQSSTEARRERNGQPRPSEISRPCCNGRGRGKGETADGT